MVSVYFLEWTDVFKPVRWGFSCHDRSLSLPYIEPVHEVIPFLMLLSLAFAAPAIMVSVGFMYKLQLFNIMLANLDDQYEWQVLRHLCIYLRLKVGCTLVIVAHHGIE